MTFAASGSAGSTRPRDPRTAEEVGSSVGNVAVSTGRAIFNEVGDIDVDVDVTRNRFDSKAGQDNAMCRRDRPCLQIGRARLPADFRAAPVH